MAKKAIKLPKVDLKAPPKRRTETCLKTKKLVCDMEVGSGWKDKNRFKLK